MEAYDLSHKLAYAGARCPVPFATGPQYTNSVPGVPVLSMLRIFIEPGLWSEENVKRVAKEVSRVLGASEQFDIGVTVTENVYEADAPAQARTARIMKLDAHNPTVVLRLSELLDDRVYTARYPRLEFEYQGNDTWQAHYAPGAMKTVSQP